MKKNTSRYVRTFKLVVFKTVAILALTGCVSDEKSSAAPTPVNQSMATKAIANTVPGAAKKSAAQTAISNVRPTTNKSSMATKAISNVAPTNTTKQQ